MRKKILYQKKWLLLFVFVFVMHLTAIVLKNEMLTKASKPLLLLVLLLYYFFNASKRSYTIIGALVFSWMGDILLLFQENNSLFFIAGLVSFLVAHLFYTVYFFARTKLNYFLVAIVILYVVGLFWFLQPKLGDMQVPVFVYATVISFMLITVLHLKKSQTGYAYRVLGAILFAISDSILAINKFHTPFAAASFFIMLTYGLAQLFLVVGILGNENDKSIAQ